MRRRCARRRHARAAMSAVITHVHRCRAAPSTVAVLPLRSPHACRHRSATALAVAPSCSRLDARAATLATPRSQRHACADTSASCRPVRRRHAAAAALATAACLRRRALAAAAAPPRSRHPCPLQSRPRSPRLWPSRSRPPPSCPGPSRPRPSLSRPPPFRPRPSRVRPTCGRPGPVLPQLARQRRAGRPRAAVPALHVRLPGHDAPALYVQPRRPSTCG